MDKKPKQTQFPAITHTANLNDFFVQLSHYATHLSLVSRKETYEYFKNKPKGQRHTNAEFAAMLKDLDTGIGMIIDFINDQGIGCYTCKGKHSGQCPVSGPLENRAADEIS